MEVIKKLEEEPEIERISFKMEFHELVYDSNTNLRIEAKKNYS